MNTRFMCDTCGSQPCMCQIFECGPCEGSGDCWNNADPTSGQRVDCEPCKGTGEVKCSGPLPDGGCAYQRAGGDICECEAAWGRQQEDYASEPPPTAQERHERDCRERQALRSGLPL